MIRYILNGFKLFSRYDKKWSQTPKSYDVSDWDAIRNWYKLRPMA